MKKAENLIVPPHLVVKAMRDNGYKNAAYAIAELIDNSIQHGAKNVSLLCAEEEYPINGITRTRINKIAVLDNGDGMDRTVLQMALQFGNGTHLDKENQKGIGRFGMGLPSSSISQAQKVEVWTWQEGIENAYYCYLDINEIVNENVTTVPEPERKEVPDLWTSMAIKHEENKELYHKSGTLVVWSEIDRCQWSTCNALFRNSELLIGRMYRHFINSNQVSIKMISFKERGLIFNEECLIRPNDPLYLMTNTSCPAPYDKEPMFEKYGGEDGFEMKIPITCKDEKHEVILRFSFVKKTARDPNNWGREAGNSPHGRHAAKNVGISIIRAGRELDMDKSWTNADSRERWWGCEVEFPPALDEVFGVTNNKQYAVNFSELGKLDLTEFLKENNLTEEQYKEQLRDENDPKAELIIIRNRIYHILGILRNQIKPSPKSGRNAETRHNVEDDASRIANKRDEEGHESISSKQEHNDAALKDDMVNNGVPEDTAEEVIQELTEERKGFTPRYKILSSSFSSSAFFSVSIVSGKTVIYLNTNHPAYDNLIEVLDDDSEIDLGLEERLLRASDGLKLLLMAWARHEDESNTAIRNKLQETREDWGRVARVFLEEED